MEIPQPLRLSLALSFSLNLVIACWALHLSHRASPAAVQAGGDAVDRARDLNRASHDPVPAKAIPRMAEIDFGNLENLENALHRRGYSPAMVRAIVNAVVDEKLAGQRTELLNLEARRPYWAADFDMGILTETRKARREYYVERGRLLQRALGAQALVPDDETRERQRIYWGGIPAEKIAALESIQRDYDDLTESLRAGRNGFEFASGLANVRNLDREMEADIKKALTEREFEEYAVRNSPMAESLRTRLARFGPTEAEFRELFRSLNSDENPVAGDVPQTNAPDAARLLAAAKRIMPADRFTALEKSMQRSHWPH